MLYLIAIVGGFAEGVFVRSLSTGREPVIFFALSAVIFVAFWYFKRHVFYMLAIVFCICAALGAVRVAISESPLPTSFATEVGKRVSYEGIVVADPDVRDANQRGE